MSLGRKTTALLATIVLSVLAVASIFSLHYQEQSLKQTIFKGVDGSAQVAAHGIAAFVDESLREAAAVSRTLPADALVEGRPAEVESYLARMLQTFPRFENGIFVLDGDGKFLVDYPPHTELRGQSFAFREYYQRTVGENRGVVGTPYRSKRTNRPVLTFTAPVRNAEGQLIAIVACSVDLLSQEALGGYRRQKYGDTGYLYVFDKSRLLVLHPEDERLLTKVEEGKNKLLEASLKGFEGAEDTVNSKGVPMLLAVRRVPGNEWTVGVQVPQKEAYRPVVEARARFVAISAIAVLLVIIIGAAAIRRVSRPLQQLERVASQISTELESAKGKGSSGLAHGALESLESIRSGDEIGRLASSFLRLAARLEETLGSLQCSAEDWERTFNSVSEALVTVDMDARIVRMNLTAERWFRISEREARGEPAHRVIFDPATPPKNWPDNASLMEEQELRWCQELEKPPGTFEFTVTPIRHASAITGAVLVIGDITERKRLERESLRVDRLESLAVLAGGIAHDFNNFLAAILGNLSVARTEARSKGPLTEILADAEQAALRAKDLTLQLLTFSKGGEPIKTRVSLAELAQTSATFALRGSSVACEYALAEDLWPVEVDKGQMSQVVHNLVLNAAQAMRGGGTIRLSAENVVPGGAASRSPDARSIRLCVEDHGVGIPPDQRQRIFDPYFTTKVAGNGLGLASAYSIVTRHGGTMHVESELGKGSTFTIHLPAVEGSLEAEPCERVALCTGRGRILLMDDDEPVRRAACRMLERLGYEVKQARDGAEALALYATAREAGTAFDAVILDLTVPGGAGGTETVRWLQEIEPRVKAIVSSGYSNDPVMADFRRYGFAGVVAKPYRIEELGETLQRVLVAPS